MSEKGSEPDIKQCRFNVSEVPGQTLHSMHLVLCASAVLGSRPDEPFPLWREQPQNGRDQEQGRNIAHEMAVLSTVVKRLCSHDRRVHDDPSPPMSALGH